MSRRATLHEQLAFDFTIDYAPVTLLPPEVKVFPNASHALEYPLVKRLAFHTKAKLGTCVDPHTVNSDE